MARVDFMASAYFPQHPPQAAQQASQLVQQLPSQQAIWQQPTWRAAAKDLKDGMALAPAAQIERAMPAIMILNITAS